MYIFSSVLKLCCSSFLGALDAKCRNVNFKSVTFISVAFYTIQVISKHFHGSKQENKSVHVKCKSIMIFLCFWVSSAHQCCIYLIKDTVKLWNIIAISNSCFLCEYLLNCNLFLWSKLYFQHHYFSLQWSSEIILIETFLIIINVENSCAAQYCVENITLINMVKY